MKKLLITFLLLIISIPVICQKLVEPDTIIKTRIYKSYYSWRIKGPSYVIYKLYKGGGDVSRRGMSFKSKLPHYKYSGSGYDKGHLVPAEDFAYSRNLELLMFSYVNALPQRPRLNRGQWKVEETKVRKLSQTDSLLIICGGSDFNQLIPDKCWKFTISLTTGKIVSEILVNQDGAKLPITKEFRGKVLEILKRK